MKFINFHIKKLNKFDEVTKIRLILLAAILILISLITPVISSLYYLLNIKFDNYIIESVTIISAIGFLKNIGLKFIKHIMNNISFSNIYKILIGFDILWGFSSLLYFYNPVYFIWVDSIISMIHATFLMAFSNSLSNYMTYFNADKYTMFQNYRNDLMSEFTILGMVLSIIFTLISIKLDIMMFFIGIILLAFYQIKFIKVFEKYDFKYMLRYKRAMKSK